MRNGGHHSETYRGYESIFFSRPTEITLGGEIGIRSWDALNSGAQPEALRVQNPDSDSVESSKAPPRLAQPDRAYKTRVNSECK